MGVSTYLGPAFVQYTRAKQLGLQPALKYLLGFFPYVIIKKETEVN